MTTDDLHPWICPRCGRFVVRTDPRTCNTCTEPIDLIEYTGADQATSIRSTSNQTLPARPRS